MKTRHIIITATASLILSACAQDPESNTSEVAERYFRSWVKVQQTAHPEYMWERTSLGCYILEETAGSGDALGDSENSPYLYMTYTVKDLDGNITQTCSESDAKLAGTYVETNYYGPTIVYRGGNGLYAGLEEVFPRMKVGGRCLFVMPGWLTSASKYSTEQKYIDKVTGDNSIYDITVHQIIEDITEWELDSLKSYVTGNYGAIDTLKTGFYYIQKEAPTDTTDFTDGQNVYLNYTGRLLNGQIFDTTIANDAKDGGIYSSDNTYESTYVSWNTEDYTEMTLGSSESSMIDGFAYMVSKMKTGEKGIGIFYSGLGYSSTAKDAIPAYSPLIFEIELIGTSE